MRVVLYTSRRVSVLRVITVERKLNHCRLAARQITNRLAKGSCISRDRFESNNDETVREREIFFDIFRMKLSILERNESGEMVARNSKFAGRPCRLQSCG